jgi:hypothetical protein
MDFIGSIEDGLKDFHSGSASKIELEPRFSRQPAVPSQAKQRRVGSFNLYDWTNRNMPILHSETVNGAPSRDRGTSDSLAHRTNLDQAGYSVPTSRKLWRDSV